MEIQAGQQCISVDDEDGVAAEKRLGEEQSAAGAQGFRLDRDRQALLPLSTRPCSDGRREVSRGEMDVRDAAAGQPGELPGEKRTTGNRHERLRPIGIKGAQSRALSAQEDDGLHGVSCVQPYRSGGLKKSRDRSDPDTLLPQKF